MCIRDRYKRRVGDAPDADGRTAQWQWLPYHIISSFVYFLLSFVSRSQHDAQRSHVHARNALIRLGLHVETLPALPPLLASDATIAAGYNLPGRGVRALAVALLENACRLQLTRLDFAAVVPLLGAASRIAFRSKRARDALARAEAGVVGEPDGGKTPQETVQDVLLGCDDGNGNSPHEQGADIFARVSVLLLLAEYHALRGRVKGARIATEFLHAIRLLPNTDMPALPVGWRSDAWQMAVSYLSLLTGDPRNELTSVIAKREEEEGDRNGAGTDEGDADAFALKFVSQHVLATAWFSTGACAMRNAEVKLSKRALSHSIGVIGNLEVGREQIDANTNSVLSGLTMTHENIARDAAESIERSLKQAQAINDPVRRPCTCARRPTVERATCNSAWARRAGSRATSSSTRTARAATRSTSTILGRRLAAARRSTSSNRRPRGSGRTAVSSSASTAASCTWSRTTRQRSARRACAARSI